MRMKYSLAMLILISALACKSNKSADKQDEITGNADNLISSEIPDSLFIKKNCVIFLWPDRNEQVEMQNKFDENSYNKFVDDMTWYTSVAGEALDSLGIENRISDKDVIILRNNKQVDLVYYRKKLKGNMLLFHVDKEPLILSTMAFNKQEVLEYFDR